VSGRGYRHSAHTADVRLTAWAPTLADAFAEAIRGTAAVTFDVDRIHAREERVIRTSQPDLARRLVALLEEVLYLIDAEGFVPSHAVVELTGDTATATLRGETFDPARHRRAGPQVKGITYHEIAVDPGPPARARLILDI
jgi:SHS2 domain-containing protein